MGPTSRADPTRRNGDGEGRGPLLPRSSSNDTHSVHPMAAQIYLNFVGTRPKIVIACPKDVIGMKVELYCTTIG